MKYVDALEGLRSQGFRNEDEVIWRSLIMQKFMNCVRICEIKRNLALMYPYGHYLEEPATIEAIRFTIERYLRVRGSARTRHYPAAQYLNPQTQAPQDAAPPQAPNLQQQPSEDGNSCEPVSIAATLRIL